MPRLFEIADEFNELFNKYDDIQEMELDSEDESADAEAQRMELLQAWFDTLDGIEGEFEVKAENTAQYIKSLKAEEAAIKAEEAKLHKRRKTYERKIENMSTYLRNCMQMMNLKKIDMPKARITLRNNAPKLVITDELSFIDMLQKTDRDYLLKYSAPEINKTAVKNLIKEGENFDGAFLEASQSLVIA